MLSLRFLKALLLLACAAALAAMGRVVAGPAGEPGWDDGLPAVEVAGPFCAPFRKAYMTELGLACPRPGVGLVPVGTPWMKR
ncbi:MAG TPA: hypothetical protein VNI01_13125 [Elusimicrobiota bacterium]|nr:hypothetical protein [Elusimicrobiota bacterium]